MEQAAHVFLEILSRAAGAPVEEIDLDKDTFASLKIDLTYMADNIVARTRRQLIVHDYDNDTIREIMKRSYDM